MSDIKEFIKLPESELEVMQAIWTLHEEGEKLITAGLIMRRFPSLCRLKLTTVLTLISRLQSKRFVVAEKINRTNCYTPLVDVYEYRHLIAEDFLARGFMGNRAALLLDLIQGGALTADEITRIQGALDAK